jgi:hypothetical protein
LPTIPLYPCALQFTQVPVRNIPGSRWTRSEYSGHVRWTIITWSVWDPVLDTSSPLSRAPEHPPWLGRSYALQEGIEVYFAPEGERFGSRLRWWSWINSRYDPTSSIAFRNGHRNDARQPRQPGGILCRIKDTQPAPPSSADLRSVGAELQLWGRYSYDGMASAFSNISWTVVLLSERHQHIPTESRCLPRHERCA